MKYALLVSDVDGTLVDKQKQVTSATIAAVERLRTAGLQFTVISARPRSGLEPIIEVLQIDAPVAAFNGGLIFRRDGAVLARRSISTDVARGVLALGARSAADIWVFADDRWHASTDVGQHVPKERVAANQVPIIRADFADLADRADKITFVSDELPVLAALQAEMDGTFGTRATVALSQPYYLDVTAAEADKGRGIAALAAATGVPLAEVVAIGDQANDLPMLAIAGLAIAMGNASDPVKAAAAHVTAANTEDGVAHAIDTIILPALETP